MRAMKKVFNRGFMTRKDKQPDNEDRSKVSPSESRSVSLDPPTSVTFASSSKTRGEEEEKPKSKSKVPSKSPAPYNQVKVPIETTMSTTSREKALPSTIKDQNKDILSNMLEPEQPSDPLLGSAPHPHSPPVPVPVPRPPHPSALRSELSEQVVFADPPQIRKSYNAIPILEQTKLPRGGVSIETKAVGRVQFGIPPETIKDSMRLGLPVPQVYLVPVERFCREMGPALGVNLAEFEFPAYFNFFVYKKKCTLVVDSEDAEENIRRVFSETLLGPAQFRREENPIAYEPEDFDPEFPRDMIPDFQKELKHFRIMPDKKELVIETLLEFRHFEMRSEGTDTLGTPPPLDDETAKQVEKEAGNAEPSDEEEDSELEDVPMDEKGVENRENTPWTYSQARFMGDCSTVWPSNATPEQIEARSLPRVEIFKMPGGTEYILHDINESNHIIGKARFSGHLKVSEFMSVDGFGGHDILTDIAPAADDGKEVLHDDSENSHNLMSLVKPLEPPPTFHPPSFGVTVLGNSHGFDKSGSVSGYVLWINGRGVMIDPPPYSSATLEREGIRPRMIVGIILTHCHADHDAGAFQKVLTGSPVVVITTPTIYKSFIRKYAALSALSPALLRHSHRFKPAIIGQPLRFQGATFRFTYTLHSIPCVGFRVEWRGRSMVFTGDHLNSPPALDMLQATGVLSEARANDLRNLPLQDTDLLLHESGAPPLHTPLEVLLQLPERVKRRLYVVHTSALPEGCELRVAPTGTAGTIRLDQQRADSDGGGRLNRDNSSSLTLREGDMMWNGCSEYETISEDSASNSDCEPAGPRNSALLASSFAHLAVASTTPPGSRKQRSNSVFSGQAPTPPLVSLRPASSTDAWFILNLLSAVPFLSSLSYASTMEVLETARVDAYSMDDIIVPASRRPHLLCVVWEGTCAERFASKSNTRRPSSRSMNVISEEDAGAISTAIWHAGDWTGPISLQPERVLSGDSVTSKDHDVVAVSSEGVKVITVEFSSLEAILRSGSALYRKYLDRKALQERAILDISTSEQHSTTTTRQLLDDAMRHLNVLELLNCNSALRKLSAVQKRHLESLAEGPVSFQPGERLWRSGAPVDRGFVIVSGTASFVPKRRNAGSSSAAHLNVGDLDKNGDHNLGDSMRLDAAKALKELGVKPSESAGDESSMSSMEADDAKGGHVNFDTHDTHDYAQLSRGLQKRADYLQQDGTVGSDPSVGDEETDTDVSEIESQLDYTFTDEADPGDRSRRSSVIRRRSSRARFANKVLGRLYNRRAFTGGLVFSRGHFLGDVSKMVAGLVSTDATTAMNDDSAPSYGFGDRTEGVGRDKLEDVTHMVIHEQEGDHQVMHSSTLTAGKDGCVVLVFPKTSLIPFLDEFPGLLLSLLGTQVVV